MSQKEVHGVSLQLPRGITAPLMEKHRGLENWNRTFGMKIHSCKVCWEINEETQVVAACPAGSPRCCCFMP